MAIENIKKEFDEKYPQPGSIKPTDPVITMGTAAKMLDISVSNLRKYEQEGLMLYHRTETGRRMLCREDIDRVRIIQHLNKNKGINFEGIRRLLSLLPCWELRPCTEKDRERCPFIKNSAKPCWTLPDTKCRDKGEDCKECVVYRFGAYCTEDIKAILHNW